MVTTPVTMDLQFLLVVAILCSAEHRTESKSTCTAPSVFVGQSANISFHFHNDIVKMEKDLIVRHYNKEGSLEEIIDCDRNLKVHPNCNVKASGYDYFLDGTTLIVKIEAAAATHEGTYICHEIPPDPHSQPCNFTLKAAEKTSSTSSTSSTSLTSSSVRTGEEPKDDSTLVIVVLAGVGVILVAAVVFIFICRKRLLARCRQCRNRSEERGVSFSNSAGGNGSVVGAGDEQSAPMLDETTAHTENETTKSELSEQPASGEVISENTAEESPLIQPSKVPKESSVLVSGGSLNTRTGPKNTAHVINDTANIESSEKPATSKVTNKKTVDNSPLGQALKMLDETGAVIIAGPEKCGKTKIGKDVLVHYSDEGYTQVTLPNPRKWLQYATQCENKFVILVDEATQSADSSVSEHAWSVCFEQICERKCPVVVLVRTSETREENIKVGLFPFLKSFPVVLVPPAAQAESKETVPTGRAEVRGNQISSEKYDNTKEKGNHLAIWGVPESTHEKPGAVLEEEERIMKTMLKEAGVSDMELDEVTYVTRLGKPRSDGAPRPLWIRVETRATTENILKKAREMNQKTGAHERQLQIKPYV